MVLFGGCFKRWGRDIADGAMEVVQEQGGVLVAPLRDSVVALAGRTYDDSVRPRLDATVAGVFDTLELRAGRIEESVAVFVEGRLNRALRTLIDSNLTALRDSVSGAVDIWTGELARGVRRDFLPIVTEAADSAVSRALVRLNENLAGPLGDALVRVVTAAADTIIERVQGAFGEEREDIETLFDKIGRTGGIIIGGILLLLTGALVTVFISARNSRRALQAVTSVVRDRGSDDLREAIKDEATDRQIEGWLNDYLRKKNLL